MKNAMPTMKDVAQEAGVALGTVSKVFNGIPVGESYRIKVEEAARKLGYQVNQYARGLKTNKTNTVAVISYPPPHRGCPPGSCGRCPQKADLRPLPRGYSTDLLAWRIQNILAELGLRVPEDVQIIGFDGIRRFGGEELYCSTIIQPAEKMAETCVDLLLAKDRSPRPRRPPPVGGRAERTPPDRYIPPAAAQKYAFS